MQCMNKWVAASPGGLFFVAGLVVFVVRLLAVVRLALGLPPGARRHRGGCGVSVVGRRCRRCRGTSDWRSLGRGLGGRGLASRGHAVGRRRGCLGCVVFVELPDRPIEEIAEVWLLDDNVVNDVEVVEHLVNVAPGGALGHLGEDLSCIGGYLEVHDAGAWRIHLGRFRCLYFVAAAAVACALLVACLCSTELLALLPLLQQHEALLLENDPALPLLLAHLDRRLQGSDHCALTAGHRNLLRSAALRVLLCVVCAARDEDLHCALVAALHRHVERRPALFVPLINVQAVLLDQRLQHRRLALPRGIEHPAHRCLCEDRHHLAVLRRLRDRQRAPPLAVALQQVCPRRQQVLCRVRLPPEGRQV
mmetsp:Transcript_8607/g.35870  ORF Transcript_8607/g.35870 Transcript_8607/m.35870 type:complete len:363 (-) Transcript_8607:558-1646(-)